MSQLPLVVNKVWGREVWLVNEVEYCCKLLEIKKGASGSLHKHPLKKETFIVSRGKIVLERGKEVMRITAGANAITILPGTPHRFTALKDSAILEISTHHDDKDVIRLEASKA